MKKKLANTAAYALYYVGDFVSKFMYMRGMSRLYYTYNWCMKKSIAIQDKYKCRGPWKIPLKH